MRKEYTITLNSFRDFRNYCKLESRFTFNGSVWSPEFSADAHDILSIFAHAPITLDFMPGILPEEEEAFDRYMKESGLLAEAKVSGKTKAKAFA